MKRLRSKIPVLFGAALLLASLTVTGCSFSASQSGAATSSTAQEQKVMDTFPTGSLICGVNVSGMTRAEAIQALNQQNPAGGTFSVTLQLGEANYVLTNQELPLASDYTKAVDSAIHTLASGTFRERIALMQQLSEAPTELATTGGTIENTAIADAVVQFAESSLNRAAVEPSAVSIQDQAFVVEPGQNGIQVNAQQLRADLLNALQASSVVTVAVPYTEVAPVHSAEEYSGTTLTCTFYGRAPTDYDTIEVTSSQTGTLDQPADQYIENASLAPGEVQLYRQGRSGKTAAAERTYYQNGAAVRTEALPSSTYPAISTLYYVGPQA